MNSHVDETAVKPEEGDEEIKRAAIGMSGKLYESHRTDAAPFCSA